MVVSLALTSARHQSCMQCENGVIVNLSRIATERSMLKSNPPKQMFNLPGKAVSQSGGVQVISRAAQILRMLASAQGLSITTIAQEVKLSRSTVHRILTALEGEGLVSTNGPSGYKVGPAISKMAEMSKMHSVEDLMPYLKRLSEVLNETVDLSNLTGNTVTFVSHVVTARRLQAVSAPGVSFPLHCTANGKAILSTLSREKQLDLLPARLERYTAHTCVSRSQLLSELERIKSDGYAFDREEHTDGICAVSVAVVAPVNERWAISVPLPASRFYSQEAKLTAALFKEARRICSEVLGFRMATAAHD
jgi:DNA-binding IclR family transcriptional regulator